MERVWPGLLTNGGEKGLSTDPRPSTGKTSIAQQRVKATKVGLREAFIRSVRQEFQLSERQHLLPELRYRWERGELDELTCDCASAQCPSSKCNRRGLSRTS